MTIDEVKELVRHLQTIRISRAYLMAYKPLGWRPKGFKFRTCFGLATILNVQDRVGVEGPHTTITFTIERYKIEQWLYKNKFGFVKRSEVKSV